MGALWDFLATFLLSSICWWNCPVGSTTQPVTPPPPAPPAQCQTAEPLKEGDPRDATPSCPAASVPDDGAERK